MSKISETQKRINEKKQLRKVEKQNVEAMKNDEMVEINTGQEIVIVNGHKFAGKVMVPKEYSHTIARILQGRKDQDRKNKQYLEHGDKRSIVHGKAFRN